MPVLSALIAALTALAASPNAPLSWQMHRGGPVEEGLALLSGGDGAVLSARRGFWNRRCMGNKPSAEPPSNYLYLDVDDAQADALQGPVYVVVTYYNDPPFGLLRLQYDSTRGDALRDRYRESDAQWGGWLMGAKRWRKAVYRLDEPAFANRQNLGADFRFGPGACYIRQVTLTTEEPANLERLNQAPAPPGRHVRIGAGGELTIGGFDPAVPSDVPGQTRLLDAVIPMLKAAGVTSHEGYVRWRLCEPKPGQYDWSVYDAYVDLYRKHEIKWVPFLLAGPAYTLPDWYFGSDAAQGYVCLEHGQTSDVESLWNPALRPHVERFIQAFCEHYRDTGVIESILLGVTGNYGEAIYVATSGEDWTSGTHGPYHAHAGFWAGDPYARADFRRWLEARYDHDPAKLNGAWHTQFEAFGDIDPFLRKDAPNDRAWLDFCAWYIGAMNDWARFWLETTRKHFPNGPVYLCTGGHAPAEHGADFAAQCKLAAQYHAGVRITNEGSDYRANFSLTRWVASAGQQYGAYYGFEPAGPVDEHGVVARVYNAAASGARNLHYYYNNLFDLEAAYDNFRRNGAQFKQRTPINDVAVYYPQTHILLHGANFLGKVQPLRDRFDFAYLSDQQIRDGGLENIHALILIDGPTAEAAVWDAIAQWVRQGGLLLYPTGMGPLRTVEGAEDPHHALVDAAPVVGQGRVAVFEGPGDSEDYRAFTASALPHAPEAPPRTRAMIAADGVEDGVYVSLCAPHDLLWLNYTGETVHKNGKKLKPWSIKRQRGKR